MKTKAMEQRLLEGLTSGQIKVGGGYEVMPSDCLGDGHDIAYMAREDESGRYDLGGGVVADCDILVRLGTKLEQGSPLAYKVIVYRPGDRTQISIGIKGSHRRHLLNTMARRAGYGECSSVYIDTSITEPRIEHSPWGFATYSGKFFPGVRTTKWYGSGYYRHAETTIFLPPKIAALLPEG